MNPQLSEHVVLRADSSQSLRDSGEQTSLAMKCQPGEDITGLAAIIGGNVRKLRKQQQLSLENLAQHSEVSRAMLSQIELGRSAPTITVLCKIAYALGVPISAFLTEDREERIWLMPASSAKMLSSKDGNFCSRALFPVAQVKPRRVEFYELRLKAAGIEIATPYPQGTIANLVVNSGAVEIAVDETLYTLAEGDAIQFIADAAHIYRNIGNTEAVLYSVMIHART